jgi:hypothetical protein
VLESTKELEWGSGWGPLDEASSIHAELKSALRDDHPLANSETTALGRCLACDDIVASVRHASGEAELAVIHLDWQGARQRGAGQDSAWPYFERLTSAVFTQRFLREGEHL